MAMAKEPDKHCSPKSVRISARSRKVPVVSVSSEDDAESRHVTITRKLSNLLPSRTLYHKKKSYACTLSPETARHRSLPRNYLHVNRTLIRNEIHRQLSSACHRGKPVVRRRTVSSDPKIEVDVGDGETADLPTEEENMASKEQRVLEQLDILRSLPIPISEKREYRDNIFHANAVPAKGKGTWNSKKEKATGKIKESFKEFRNKLQIWSSTLKFIEGHFGTSVVSYFVFLRWLLFLNLYTFVILLVFIILPQIYFPALQQRKNITNAFSGAENKSYQGLDIINDEHIWNVLGFSPDNHNNNNKAPKILDETLNYNRINHTEEERYIISEYCHENYTVPLLLNTKYDAASVIQDVFQGTGWMELTLMFIGFYLPTDLLVSGTSLYYNLPMAFLGVLFGLCIVCLIMMIKYASKGVRETLLSAESSVQSYCNMVFCAWDYCIASPNTALLKHKSILLELKGNLAEARRQAEIAQWTVLHKIKVHCIRFIVNIIVIASLVGTYYVTYYAAEKQIEEQRNEKRHEPYVELFLQFLPSITITAVNLIMPLIFNIFVRYESYGIQAALNITLVRIIFVRLASVTTLVITFYRQITCEPRTHCGMGFAKCPSPKCWETHVGQQMYRLVVMDFVVVVAVTFLWEVPRNFVVRKWKCKLTEMIGRQTFDVPSQVLEIVYAQTLCWLGLFYSPLLPAVCVIKIIILFYIKKFTLMVNCVPAQIPYRASRSNAVFIIVLTLNFIITVAILGYSISRIAPSQGCSPFRYLNFMTDAIEGSYHPVFVFISKYIFSTEFAVIVIFILCLAIYYYHTITAAHKLMTKVLKSQLIVVGRDKQFLLSRLTEAACQGMSEVNY